MRGHDELEDMTYFRTIHALDCDRLDLKSHVGLSTSLDSTRPHGQRLLLRPAFDDFRARPHAASAGRALGHPWRRPRTAFTLPGAAVAPRRRLRHPHSPPRAP